MMKQMRSNTLTIIVLLMLLSACKVGQKFSRPQLELPEAYQSDSTDSDLMDWKSFFSDTVLVGLINHALLHNFDVQTTLKNIDIAQSYYKQSNAAFFPSINADLLGVARQYRSGLFYANPSGKWYDQTGGTPPANMFNYQSQFSNTFSVSWEIDIWGKLRWQREEALSQYMESFEVQRALQTNLIAEISANYYSLLMLDEQLEVAQRNYTYRKSNLDMVELQYVAGEVTALAVQQTKAQMLEAAALIPKLEEEIVIHQNGLMLLTGRLPQELTRGLKITDINIEMEYNVLQDIPLAYVRNRPDVMVAEYELKTANARMGVAQAFQYPNLTLSLNGGLNSMLPQNWFNIPGALLGGFTTGLAQPLFNKRKLRTDFEVAKKQREIAEIDYQRNVYEAVVETNNIMVSLQKLEEQLAIGIEQVELARKAVDNADLLFKAGFATYLEVITAQRFLLDVELDLVTVKANLLIKRIHFYRALGGGWR